MSLPAFVLWIFTFNLLTFGNGPGMIPLLQEELVERWSKAGIDFFAWNNMATIELLERLEAVCKIKLATDAAHRFRGSL